jgi:hypothetical protein
MDGLGTAQSSGPCSISYFGNLVNGAAGPAPQISTVIPAGGQLSFSLSHGNAAQGIAPAPGFRGYIMADCAFALARGAATVTGTIPPADERFARLLYTNALLRDASLAEIDYWVNLLKTGTNRMQAAAGFFNSNEYHAYERFTAGLYVGILGRDAEFQGWMFHRTNLRRGTATQLGLIGDFLASNEYLAKYGNPPADTFIGQIYQNALGRVPAPGEVAYWLGRLSGGDSRAQVILEILASNEFRTGRANRLNVFLAYATFLSRDADPVGFNYWLGQLNGGAALETVLDGFVNSSEFTGLLNNH